MDIKITYQNNDLLVVDKPAGLPVFKEGNISERTLADYLLEKFPELQGIGENQRCGIVHRLDKETSGILLVAKNNKTFAFLQEQFKKGEIEKKYTALVVGKPNAEEGTIETLLGRNPNDGKKQKVFMFGEPASENLRKAITQYRVLKNFEDYSLIEAVPKTGRKHQIRCHMAYLQHPLAGDKMYGFKKQPCPEGLTRHFLHASYLKIKLPSGEIKEFQSELPEELKSVLENLKIQI